MLTFLSTFSMRSPYLCLNRMDLVPLAVAKPELIVRLEDGHDGSPAVVHRECHGAVHHLEDHEVLPALDGENDASGVPVQAKFVDYNRSL